MTATLAGLAPQRKLRVSFVSVPGLRDSQGGVLYFRVTGRLNTA